MMAVLCLALIPFVFLLLVTLLPQANAVTRKPIVIGKLSSC